MVCITLLLGMCTKTDKDVYTFTSTVDLTGSTLSTDALNTVLVFSTDNGKTFEQFPTALQVGTKYQVALKNMTLGRNLTDPKVYAVDWSASNPKPNNPTSTTPEFTLSGSNSIKAILTCPYNAATWTGVWGGDEVGACCGGTDKNNIIQDTSNPNKFIMDNFWGDHVSAYVIFSPSTDPNKQIVTMPTQTTADPGVASGTGTYDQCRGTFTINTTYVAFGGTYNWQYNFHR